MEYFLSEIGNKSKSKSASTECDMHLTTGKILFYQMNFRRHH